MQINTAILILNWNGAAFLEDCLNSVLPMASDNTRICVIDNHSNDNSVSFVTENYPGVDLIQLSENYLYAGGNNRGAAAIRDLQAEYYLFLNNDTVADSAMVTELLKASDKFGKENVYGPKILYNDAKDRLWYAGGNLNLRKGVMSHRGIRETDTGQYDRIEETGFVTGCCLMISSDLFQKLNGFDESFRMYNEDVDLCLRARTLNSRCYFVPEARLYHKVSASIGGNLSVAKNRRKLRSAWQLYKKHMTGLARIFGFISYMTNSMNSAVKAAANS